MARFPRPFRQYAVSDIVSPIATRKDDPSTSRNESWRGYGSDGTEDSKYGYILYIGSDTTERMVLFKGFVETLKMNFSKGRDETTDKDQNEKIAKEYNGKFHFDLSINIPAHSVNESRNNLAKIAELQRLIMPNDTEGSARYAQGFTPEDTSVKVYKQLFSVYFRNLINSGKDYSGILRINEYADLYNHGFQCIIDTVTYNPVMEMGFFEFDNYKFPKLIKLDLKLVYETSPKVTDVTGYKAFSSFNLNGCYDPLDSGIFPFLVTTKPAGSFKEQKLKSYTRGADFTVSSMNSIQYLPSNTRETSYIFFSLTNNKNTGPSTAGLQPNPSIDKRIRYVVFKPFIETFNRSVKSEIEEKESKNMELNHIFKDISFDEISYKLSFTVPAQDLQEAKKNCAKVQYLMRMFYKRSELPNPDQSKENLFVRCYVPSKIETGDSNGAPANPSNFEQMYNKSLAVQFSTMNINIVLESGFFEENGKIYPKVMTIETELKILDNLLMQPYKRKKTGEQGPFGKAETVIEEVQGAKAYRNIPTGNNAALFPFNRKYTDIKVSEPNATTTISTAAATTTATTDGATQEKKTESVSTKESESQGNQDESAGGLYDKNGNLKSDEDLFAGD